MKIRLVKSVLLCLLALPLYAGAEDLICSLDVSHNDSAPNYHRVARVGDVNNDGLPDFAFVVPAGSGNRRVSIRNGYNCTIIREHVLPNVVDVGGAGDVNNDGFADIVIANSIASGQVFSGADGSSLHASLAEPLIAGYTADGVGDINGDGYDDFAIGDFLDNGFTGRVRVYSGVNGSALHTIDGPAGHSFFGRSLSGVGDVNNDGVPDFAVGCPSNDSTYSTVQGRVIIYSGANAQVIHTILGDQFGEGVAGAGDVNGDGYDDILVKVAVPGSIFLISGQSGNELANYSIDEFPYNYRTSDSIDIVGLFDGDSRDDYIVNGIVYSHSSGVLSSYPLPNTANQWHTSVGLGDVNDDTVPEYVIGNCGSNTCTYYVVEGDRCLSDPEKTHPGQCGCGVPDTDSDNDGSANCVEECDNDPQKTAPGICGCGVSDVDTDSDGTSDCQDLCPHDPTKVTDRDSDGDLTPDCEDGCVNDPGKTTPGVCGCGTPETGDSDLDGAHDCNEECDNDPLKTAPGICGCGTPDTDSDGDGTFNCFDLCPLDPLKIQPLQCGCGFPEGSDSDGDGTLDCNDQCPSNPFKIHPGVCGCSVNDIDTDGDGTFDCNDFCLYDPGKIFSGICGCGVADTDDDFDSVTDCHDNCPGIYNLGQIDSDGDGTGDDCDLCPIDFHKVAPGICGCGILDSDSDGDGVPNCVDLCPGDALKIVPGICDCGVSDVDSDNDNVSDCLDSCDFDPFKNIPGICGCGLSDADSDGDGIPNCLDICPANSSKASPGTCGCGVSDSDLNLNGVADCLDPNSSTIPLKPVVKVQKQSVLITMQAFLGAKYIVSIKPKGSSPLVKKLKKNSLKLKSLTPGSYSVSYRVVLGVGAVQTETSDSSKRAFKIK